MPIRQNHLGTYDVVDGSGRVILSNVSLSQATEVDNRHPSELDNMVGQASAGCVGWLFAWCSQPVFRQHPLLLTRLAFIFWPGAIALYIYNAHYQHPANIYLILTAMALLFLFPSPIIRRILRVFIWIAVIIAVILIILGIAYNAHWI